MSHPNLCSNMQANLDNEKFFLDLVHAGLLKITKSGRAFNQTTGKEIGRGSAGYRKLSWQHPQTKKIIQVQLHRIVWAVFKGLPEDPSLEVNHKNGRKDECRLANLELNTAQHNVKHALRAGLTRVLRGEARSNAVFTDAQVIQYRRRFNAGTVSLKELAQEAETGVWNIRYMIQRKTYSHLGP